MGKKQVKQKGEITMEKINDIVREMRIGDLCAEDTSAARPAHINDILASYADRIDAAWKAERERAKADALVVGGMVEAMRREKRGNAAKMRDALSDACYAMFNFLKTQNGGYEEMANALDKAKATLAEPIRNCDVGTAEEQLKRFNKFCFPIKCKECKLYTDEDLHDCIFRWHQMPYEEGGAEWMV